MFRYTSLFILLSASLIVVAQPLYKWVEPDGSITFSPVKPPAGTKYETVNQTTADQATVEKSSNSLSSTASTGQSSTGMDSSDPADTRMPQPARALPAQTITSAAGEQPESGSLRNTQPRAASSIEPSLHREAGNPSERITLESGSKPATASMGAQSAPTIQTAPAQQTPNMPQNRKQRQCQDLQKRVISLERRLKSRLTPEDMDNTVIHMARYQRSFDQHCVQ